MRIALVASVGATVSSARPRGVETAVAELEKMLTRIGHTVTIYAATDSLPVGAQPFDVIHAHDAATLALRGDSRVPMVLTVHPGHEEALREHPSASADVAYVATSSGQAARVGALKFRAVVRTGLDPDDYPAVAAAGEYCAFVGALAPEDAPHLAIDAARRAAVPLKLAAPEHTMNADYFADEMLPRLDAAGGAVRWLGSLSGAESLTLVKNARAVLMPSSCDEPLAAIEAMMSGTPVIALARGAALDVVDDGVTGFLVQDAKELASRLAEVGALDRARCREWAVARFSSLRMATEYEALYEQLAGGRRLQCTARMRAVGIVAVAARDKRRYSGLFSPLWEA